MYDDFDGEECGNDFGYSIRYRQEKPIRNERLMMAAKRNLSSQEKHAITARFGNRNGTAPQCSAQRRKRVACVA